MLALPTVLPTVELCIPVQLDKYAHFQFDSNRYSAPPRYTQGTLTLCARDSELRLLDKHQVVARHPRCWGRGQHCTLRAHEQELLTKRPAARMPTAQDRLRRAFPKMDQLLGRWLQQGSNIGLLTLRAHKLLDLYGAERFARAAALALERDTTNPAALAQLLEQLRKQELAPVPTAGFPTGPGCLCARRSRSSSTRSGWPPVQLRSSFLAAPLRKSPQPA